MGKLRASKAPKSTYSARNAQAVLNGKQIVKELKGTMEGIGSMSIICPKCLAKNCRGRPALHVVMMEKEFWKSIRTHHPP